jgi:hypothetical protein
MTRCWPWCARRCTPATPSRFLSHGALEASQSRGLVSRQPEGSFDRSSIRGGAMTKETMGR